MPSQVSSHIPELQVQSHPGSPIAMIVVVCLRQFLAGNLLANQNKCLITIVFGAARHNNVVSSGVRFEEIRVATLVGKL